MIKLGLKRKINKIKAFLEERGAKDVTFIDLDGATDVAECFVVATFESIVVLRSSVRDLWEVLESLGLKVNSRHKEVGDDGWYVIDCGNVVIHLFGEEMREFYSLDKLWEGYKTKISETKDNE